MNIFVLDERPFEAARAHCDCHVVKMILETTQILCGVHHRFGVPFEGIYKPTHLEHPCVLWATSNLGSYDWAWLLLDALLVEYAHRYDKQHACRALANKLLLAPLPLLVTEHPMLHHVFVGPDECRDPQGDTVASYRNLYNLKATAMKRSMRWTRREPPSWFSGGTELPAKKATA